MLYVFDFWRIKIEKPVQAGHLNGFLYKTGTFYLRQNAEKFLN